MSTTFDDALKIARKSIGDMTGDMTPEVLSFELQNGFNFRFRTVKGNYSITIDQSGSVGRFVREDAPAPQASAYRDRSDDHDRSTRSPQGGISQQAAVEKALSHVGGGRVEEVKPSNGGWEIEINRGMIKGKTEVYVDANGTVQSKKRSRMEMLDFEFD